MMRISRSIQLGIIVVLAALFVGVQVSHACHEGINHKTGDPCGGGSEPTVGGMFVIHAEGLGPSGGKIPTGSTAIPYPMPRDATIQNMRILIVENNLDGDTEVILTVNGANTILRSVILANDTNPIMVNKSVDVIDGDEILLILAPVAGSEPISGGIQLSVTYNVN